MALVKSYLLRMPECLRQLGQRIVGLRLYTLWAIV